MKKLKAAFMDAMADPSPGAVSKVLDQQQRLDIHEVPWPAYPYRPSVQFAMAYSSHAIFLKYYVREKSIRAVHAEPNSPVYEDSCVEFFIAVDDHGYYNLEFNLLGTCLAAFGTDRDDRTHLDAAVIQTISHKSCLQYLGGQPLFAWELTLVLPFALFIHHSFPSWRGLRCRANFYKCGDLLPQPHFLSWSPVQAPAPNFHLPHYFGEVLFE